MGLLDTDLVLLLRFAPGSSFFGPGHDAYRMVCFQRKIGWGMRFQGTLERRKGMAVSRSLTHSVESNPRKSDQHRSEFPTPAVASACHPT